MQCAGGGAIQYEIAKSANPGIRNRLQANTSVVLPRPREWTRCLPRDGGGHGTRTRYL